VVLFKENRFCVSAEMTIATELCNQPLTARKDEAADKVSFYFYFIFYFLHQPVVPFFATDNDTYPSGGEAANQAAEIN
jgi:hypothetical protein